MTSGTKPDALNREALADELRRVTDLFRRMPHSKFQQKLEPYGDRSSAGAWLASQLAALAQGTEEWDSPEAPRWRRMPDVGAFALGDQIAVVGHDLLAAFDALPEMNETQVWTPGDGRVPAEKALAAVLESTAALRRVL
jgi:hypothetical protein